jgi:hypothetical protein
MTENNYYQLLGFICLLFIGFAGFCLGSKVKQNEIKLWQENSKENRVWKNWWYKYALNSEYKLDNCEIYLKQWKNVHKEYEKYIDERCVCMPYDNLDFKPKTKYEICNTNNENLTYWEDK